MHRIKWRICEAILIVLTAPSAEQKLTLGLKPYRKPTHNTGPLRVSKLIRDKWVPDWMNVQTGLTDETG
jgi:hypothetical protein